MKNAYLSIVSRKRMLLVFMAMTAGTACLPVTAMANTAAQVVQQAGIIKGHVVDQNGDPVIGATVKIKGEKSATVTDFDGNFELKGTPGTTLLITYIGYKDMEVKAKNGMVVKMEEEDSSLSEVVVVGYGTMRKKDLTGSVIQIKPDKLANENPRTVQDLLRGAAGMNIGLSSSAKGDGQSIQIRGQRSLGTDATPLIILDGMMFYGEMSEINPDDIGQIDILKDASAAAVYGAKAANGVIIITTKKGKLGKPTINVSANFGFNTRGDGEKMRSADGYVKMYQDYMKSSTYGFDADGNYVAYAATDSKGNLVAQPGFYDTPADAQRLYGLDETAWAYGESGDSWKAILGNRLGFKDAVLQNYIDGKTYDWYDSQFRTGFNQDYNASVSGASEKMNYYLSFGYLNNESAYVDDDYSAFRVNMKVSGKVTNWLEIGANVNFQDRKEDNTGIYVGDDADNSPYGTYMNEDGTLAQYPHGDNVKQGSNYDFLKDYYERERGYTVLNSIFNAKVTLPLGITYNFNIAPRYQWYYNRYFSSAELPGSSPKDKGVNRNWSKNFDWSLNNTITWDHTFAKKHHVVLTLVQEAEERRYWSDNTSVTNIQPSDALGFHNTQNTVARTAPCQPATRTIPPTVCWPACSTPTTTAT